MSSTECRVDIKNHIQKFKQEMINTVVDELGKEGNKESGHSVELIKLINNLSDEYIISSALELALNNDDFYESVTQNLIYAIENEMPF